MPTERRGDGANAPSRSEAPGNGILRAVAGVAALGALTSAVQATRVHALEQRFEPLHDAPFLLALYVTALLAGWYAPAGGRASIRRRMASALLWAGIVGCVTFAVGFFGPMVATPGANQGPLLGIFVTGPAGFAAGMLFGRLVPSLLRPRSPGAR